MPFNPGNKRAQRARNVPTVGGPMKFGLYPTVGVSLPFLMKLTRCCGPKNAACSGKREAVVACGASVQVCKACNVPLTCSPDVPKGTCVSQEDIRKQVYPVVDGDCGPSGFAPRYCRDCCGKAGKKPGNGLALGPVAYRDLQEELLSLFVGRNNEKDRSASLAKNTALDALDKLMVGVLFANGLDQPPTFFDLSTAQKEEEVEKVIKESKNFMSDQLKRAKERNEDQFTTLNSYLDNFLQEANALLSDKEKELTANIEDAQLQLKELMSTLVVDEKGLAKKKKKEEKIKEDIKDLSAQLQATRDELSTNIRGAQSIKDDLARTSLEQSISFRNMEQTVVAFGTDFNLTGDDKTDVGRLKKAKGDVAKELGDTEKYTLDLSQNFAGKIGGFFGKQTNLDPEDFGTAEGGNLLDALEIVEGGVFKSLSGLPDTIDSAITKQAQNALRAGKEGGTAVERQILEQGLVPGDLDGLPMTALFERGFGVETWKELVLLSIMNQETYGNAIDEYNAEVAAKGGPAM